VGKLPNAKPLPVVRNHAMLALVARTIETTYRIIATICLAVTVCIVTVEVFFRYVLNQSLFIADELARVLFIWIVFLGAALVLRSDDHIRMEFMTKLLPETGRRLAKVLADLLVLCFAVGFLYASLRLLPDIWGNTLPTLSISKGWALLALPLSAGAMVIFLLESMLRYRKFPNWNRRTTRDDGIS
jgi:TRAP-type C4-dicarboxylate transport system permease small subunit